MRSAFEDAFTHAPIGMALVDITGGLTGLLNSRGFGRALAHERKSAARYGDAGARSAERRIAVTASVGIAMFDGRSSAGILAAADLAMYEAKAGGRDRFSRCG